VAEWRKNRKQRYSTAGDKGGFRIVPRKVLDSDAFNELSKTAKIVLILSLAELDYWNRKKHKGLPKRSCSVGDLRNDGRFSLPNNLLVERGVKGSDTFARVRKELVQAGFWDVVETGTLQQSGVFRWSDRWLLHGQTGERDRKRQDPDAKPAGYCLYPNIERHNQDRRAEKVVN
jgi:hypothetical protein